MLFSLVQFLKIFGNTPSTFMRFAACMRSLDISSSPLPMLYLEQSGTFSFLGLAETLTTLVIPETKT